MDLLTKLEELALLAVTSLKDEAYGIAIYKHIQKGTGKKMSVGSVYFPLERLTKRGYLSTVKGEPTPKRGGMSKKYYSITKEGIAALEEAKKVNDTMWRDYIESTDFMAGS